MANAMETQALVTGESSAPAGSHNPVRGFLGDSDKRPDHGRQGALTLYSYSSSLLF